MANRDRIKVSHQCNSEINVLVAQLDGRRLLLADNAQRHYPTNVFVLDRCDSIQTEFLQRTLHLPLSLNQCASLDSHLSHLFLLPSQPIYWDLDEQRCI